MCSTILQVVYIAGIVVATGLTIGALVTPAWRAGETGNWDSTSSLIWNCGKDVSSCKDSFSVRRCLIRLLTRVRNFFCPFQNLTGYQQAAASLLILAILVCAAAFVWAVFTCCACCCHACLFPLMPIFSGVACGLNVVAIIVYAVNTDGLTANNIGYSMWLDICAALLLAADTVIAIFLCECCACCP